MGMFCRRTARPKKCKLQLTREMVYNIMIYNKRILMTLDQIQLLPSQPL